MTSSFDHSDSSPGLLTDLYQLTMAQGYWRLGRADRQAVFHLFFRKAPFGGRFAVTAGLGPVLDYLEAYRFDRADLDYLATLRGNDDEPIFHQEFLDYLEQLELDCQVDALPEGTVAFGLEPILRVQGAILQCQLLETALLNIINFQTLIATKAARICHSAGDDPVLEFGLRRAQGVDGGLAASRAAYIGGCAGTSNVLAGKRFGIPVRGTHAHSWIMSFDSEPEAFEGYASVMPNNCVFLVDTYDTLEGVRRAVEVGRRLRDRGHRMVGIRLDSGDLAYLSIEARKILDAAGFKEAAIVASNDLDERIIESLKHEGATIAVWGVGTKLATAYDQPALGGVYKLGAIENDAGDWQLKLKLSEQPIKTSIPGFLQVRRFENGAANVADMIYDQSNAIDPRHCIVDPTNANRRRAISAALTSRDLLIPVMERGRIIAGREPLARIRDRAVLELRRLHPSVRRLLNPHEYPVGIDIGLHERREQMIDQHRSEAGSATSTEGAP